MQTIEPFSLTRHVEQLDLQLQHRQLASHQTAVEIALHIRGSALADYFVEVTQAIELLDFLKAHAALRQFASHLWAQHWQWQCFLPADVSSLRALMARHVRYAFVEQATVDAQWQRLNCLEAQEYYAACHGQK